MSESRQKDRFQKERSEAEGILWARLRDGHAGHKFRQQVAVGSYIADFMTLPLKIIVEVERAHADKKRNEARMKVLNALGYEVLRLSETSVIDDADAALKAVSDALSKREKAKK